MADSRDLGHVANPGVPRERILIGNDAAVSQRAEFVLYWMIANRRVAWNFSLQRAIEWATQLNKPLVVLEPLRCGYRWASDRLHQFILDGMADNAARLERTPAHYYSYVEAKAGDGHGLLAALAERACAVVTDDYPAFFYPSLLHAAAQRSPIRFEIVDSNGLYPIRSSKRLFGTAYAFRRYLQKNIRTHLSMLPYPEPLAAARLTRLEELPAEITERWPDFTRRLRDGSGLRLDELPIDHSVGAAGIRGGTTAGVEALGRFVSQRLPRYAANRNQPEIEATSGLSPYLHFGHLSSHQIFAELMDRENWDVDRLGSQATGQRRGWWGASENAEAILDQLVTWRELGFNMCVERSDYDTFDSLPDWARDTLAAHASDPRPHVYASSEFEEAQTHDRLWNAAQNQLLREGRMHNYLRMLWGKKILEWSTTPTDALETMIELNNTYALDGRDPNSYSGIFWCLGRYDRPWGPERPIFGKVRYMSSENTARKLRVKNFIEKYG